MWLNFIYNSYAPLKTYFIFLEIWIAVIKTLPKKCKYQNWFLLEKCILFSEYLTIMTHFSHKSFHKIYANVPYNTKTITQTITQTQISAFISGSK